MPGGRVSFQGIDSVWAEKRVLEPRSCLAGQFHFENTIPGLLLPLYSWVLSLPSPRRSSRCGRKTGFAVGGPSVTLIQP